MWFTRLFSGDHPTRVPLYLYNTLGKEKQEFTLAPHAQTVRLYNCGPTVYDVQHIGNLSAYIFADILRRTLEYNGFSVKQVINITDVGHLTSDADEGEDKMSKGLQREGLEPTLENMAKLGERYTQIFLEDLRKLNIDTERITFPRASHFIAGQIAMVKTLEEKGYAYRAKDGVYFDTARYPGYGALGGANLAEMKDRVHAEAKSAKRNPTDFALWKLDLPAEATAQAGEKMGWDSPWGKGFPGWHIECSSMIHATLGRQIDIHTGGMEHIAIHHNNEIAQSEAVTGKKPLSRFWMHRAHIQFGGGKMSKSERNVVYLSEAIERAFHPLAVRYLLLGAHYRTPTNFTWEALSAAQTSFLKLRRLVDAEEHAGAPPSSWRNKIHERFNDDLDTPGALALVWDMLRDKEIARKDAKAVALDADRVFGLGLDKPDTEAESLCKKIFGVPVELKDLPERIRSLVDAREAARKEKNWQHADALRNDLQKLGYSIEDKSDGPQVFKKSQ